ncbi:hypothetical protein AB0F07_22575 [Streptomyces fructofermentans]|uniref:hypothetical protein n=1 Tax=Streptomyces fructofermentans TaxID=152141 RepID=UPI0033E7CD68
MVLEEFGPVSEPVPYRGRKGIITYWPVTTREQTVVCGSLRQWRLAVELDSEPGWAAFCAGPMELQWRAGGRLRRWCPDFLARTADGVREVLVLKPPGQETLPASRLQVLEEVARAAGWRVRQVREPTFNTPARPGRARLSQRWIRADTPSNHPPVPPPLLRRLSAALRGRSLAAARSGLAAPAATTMPPRTL